MAHHLLTSTLMVHKSVKLVLTSLSLGVILTLVPSQVYAQEQATQGSILWQGFAQKWQNNPHRLSQLGSYFSDVEYSSTSTGAVVAAKHKNLFRVGAYNDTAHVKTKGQFFSSSALEIYHGATEPECLEVKGEIGKKAVAYCEITLPLSSLGFKNPDQMTVIMRGFRIKSKSYATGYNTRGFSIRLIPGRKTANSYTFRARFAIHPEHAPDRPFWDDGCSQGNHCQQYHYGAKVFYTLVGVKTGQGHITENPDSPTNTYGQHVVMQPGKNPEMASAHMRQSYLNGAPDHTHGVVGIQGFSWFLDDWNRTKKDGRYIRELKMDLSHVEYDPQSGQARFRTNMHFDNQGAWPYGYKVNYKMWNTLIQFNDPEGQVTEAFPFEGQLERGESVLEEAVFYRF